MKLFKIGHIGFVASLLLIITFILIAQNDNFEFVNNDVSETVGYLFISLGFTYLLFCVIVIYIKENIEINILNVFVSMIITSVIGIIFIIISFFLLYDNCVVYNKRKVFFNIEDSQKHIELRDFACGFDGTVNLNNYFEVQHCYIIFNKIEEIDTNTLEMSEWKRVNRNL